MRIKINFIEQICKNFKFQWKHKFKITQCAQNFIYFTLLKFNSSLCQLFYFLIFGIAKPITESSLPPFTPNEEALERLLYANQWLKQLSGFFVKSKHVVFPSFGWLKDIVVLEI